MVQIIWEFVVEEQRRGRFELTFGPGGAWSRLAAGRPGFRGTMLLADTHDPNRFLVIDLWDSAADRERLADEQPDELAALDAALAALVVSRAKLGVFGVRAQGTVRPARQPPSHRRRR